MTCAAGTDGHRGGRTRPGCRCGHGHRRHRDGHRRHPGQDGDQRRRHRRAGTRPHRGHHGHRRDGPRRLRRRAHHGRDRRRGHLGHARAAAACCSGWAAGHRAGPYQPGWGGQDRASQVAAASQAGGHPDQAPRGRQGHLGQSGPGAVRCVARSPCRTRPGRTGCCPGGAPDGGRDGHQAGARLAAGHPDPGRPGRNRPGRNRPARDRAAGRPAAGRAPGHAAAAQPGWPARRRWAPAEPGRAAPGQPGAGPRNGVPGRPTGLMLGCPTGWPPAGLPPAGQRQPTGWGAPPGPAAGLARAAARDGCHCRLPPGRPGPAQAGPAAACPGSSAPGRRTHP